MMRVVQKLKYARSAFLDTVTRHRSVAVLTCSLAICHIAHSEAQASGIAGSDERSAVKAQVTVADAIEMTQIGYRPSPDDSSSHTGVVEFSPDRSKFAFVTQKGNLENNTVEFSLLVFQTADAFKSPIPQIVARLASSSNRNARWRTLPGVSRVLSAISFRVRPSKNTISSTCFCASFNVDRVCSTKCLFSGYVISHGSRRGVNSLISEISSDE